MSLFPKSRKNQLSADNPASALAQPTPEPTELAPWAMTEEKYEALMSKLGRMHENQLIIDGKLNRLRTEVAELHSDVRVSINNELLLIQRQDDQTQILKQIQYTVNK